MNGFVLSWIVLFLSSVGYSQILIGESEPEEKKKEKVNSKDTTNLHLPDGSTFVYIVTNWSVTNRLLVTNGEKYGDTLGVRANENSLNIWSFGIGLQNKLNEYLMWDGGIAYMRNGESYIFNDIDTSYSYETTYTYVGMPLRLNYTVGKDIRFYAGAGLIPQMFFGYRQDRSWITSTDNPGKETFKTKSGYNSFVLSAVINVGIALKFQENWSLLVSPEARIQLNSSYPKQDDYIHKARAYGITFGLLRSL